MAKPIGTLGTIETLQVGGRVFTDMTNLIVLGGTAGSISNTSLRRLSPAQDTAGYAVTAAKTLTISAISLSCIAAQNVQLLYADNDVGASSATVFTNPVYLYGNSNSYLIIVPTSTSLVDFQRNPFFRIPAAKIPGVAWGTTATSSIFAYGYEA